MDSASGTAQNPILHEEFCNPSTPAQRIPTSYV